MNIPAYLVIAALLSEMSKELWAITDSEDPVSIVFAGDISFSGPVQYYVQHGYHTYNDSFRHVAPYIREADIAVANVESPFVTENILASKVPERLKLVYLGADAKSAAALSYAGFDLAGLANNHLNDFGDAAVNFTVRTLSNEGVAPFGVTYGLADSAQVPIVTEVKGVTIGFLGYCVVNLRLTSCEQLRKQYNAGPAVFRYEDVTRDVKALKKRVDVMVVFMHWGEEYHLRPIKRQRLIANQLESLGVHVIIGSHPHVLQPHCRHGNRVVAFSLGNFLFPWHIPEPSRKSRFKDKHMMEFYEASLARCLVPDKASRLFRVWINKRGVLRADYLPLSIEFDPSHKCLQPKPTKGADWIEVCGPHDKACMSCQ